MSEFEKILEIDDSNDFSVAITDFVWSLDIPYEELPQAVRTVYCIAGLEMEVNNGGFEQYFYNTAGDYTAETLHALHEIGATSCAVILSKAINLFPAGEPPRDRDERQARLEDLPEHVSEAWGALDQEFFAYPDDLAALLRSYVIANKSQFLAR